MGRLSERLDIARRALGTLDELAAENIPGVRVLFRQAALDRAVIASTHVRSTPAWAGMRAAMSLARRSSCV
jgi:hypothetical protein